MTERLTINRQFHVTAKRSGTKQIQSGAKPVIPAGRVPRISRLLALAHHCFRLVRTGAIINQSELAHFGQISTTRMKQIMWLDNLAPDIQEKIFFLPRTNTGRDAIKEADIRPIAKTLDWTKQRQMWNRLRQGVTDVSSPSLKSSMAWLQRCERSRTNAVSDSILQVRLSLPTARGGST